MHRHKHDTADVASQRRPAAAAAAASAQRRCPRHRRPPSLRFALSGRPPIAPPALALVATQVHTPASGSDSGWTLVGNSIAGLRTLIG